MHHREKFETVKISMLFDENNSTIIIQIIDSLILLISSIFAIAKVEFQFEFQSFYIFQLGLFVEDVCFTIANRLIVLHIAFVGY